MKNFNFKRNQSVFETLSEPKRQKPTISFDRLMYFVIVLLIFLGIIYYFGKGFLFVKANGHVLFDKVHVRLPNDIFITKFYKSEGDYIVKGDTLFEYENIDETKLAQTSMIKNQQSSWINQQIIQTQNKLNQIKIEMEFSQNKILEIEEDVNRTKLEVSIDLQNRKILQDLNTSLYKELLNVEKFKEEVKSLQLYLFDLENQNIIQQTASLADKKMYYFVSPIDANITKLMFSNFETVLKGDEILNIHSNNNIHIRGYFEQKDLKYIKIGDELAIYFPDGSQTIGVVNRFYHSTYSIATEFQKKHEPTKRVLGVDIIPKNEQEKDKWKAFYKLGVEIKKNKF